MAIHPKTGSVFAGIKACLLTQSIEMHNFDTIEISVFLLSFIHGIYSNWIVIDMNWWYKPVCLRTLCRGFLVGEATLVSFRSSLVWIRRGWVVGKSPLIGGIQVVGTMLTNNPCKPSDCSSLLKKWWANWHSTIISNFQVPKLTGNANLLRLLSLFLVSGMSSSQIGSVDSRLIHLFIFNVDYRSHKWQSMCFAKRLGLGHRNP